MGDAEVLEALVGAWRLHVVEDRDDATGPWVPYGPEPGGVIVYDGSGTVSVHIVANGPAPTTDGYLGYWGRFAIAEAHREGDAIVGTLEHHMDGASDRELFDDEPERPFVLRGDELEIGDGRTWRRVLARIRPEP